MVKIRNYKLELESNLEMLLIIITGVSIFLLLTEIFGLLEFSIIALPSLNTVIAKNEPITSQLLTRKMIKEPKTPIVQI